MTFTRRQLFDLVWSKPIQQLAKEYGYSDVGLAKICRKHDIPLPPRGYWSKVSAGLKTKIPNFDTANHEQKISIPLKKAITDEDVKHKKNQLELEREMLTKVGEINISNPFESHHQITRNTRKFFNTTINKLAIIERSRTMPDDYFSIINVVYRGRIRCKKESCFHMTVSEPLVNRALNILDALVKNLEIHGFKIQNGQEKVPVQAYKDNEVLNFSISEGYNYQINNKKKEKSKLEQIFYPDKIPIANGKLTLTIVAPEANINRSWTDGKRTIENELSSILVAFINLVSTQKQSKIDKFTMQKVRDEEMRVIRDIEQKRYVEKSLFDEVMRESKLFSDYVKLEAYLEYLERQYMDRHGIVNEKILAWFSLIRKIAKEQSPFENRINTLNKLL